MLERAGLDKSGSDGVVQMRLPDTGILGDLQVQTWFGRYPVDSDGRFVAEFPEIDDNRFAFVSHEDDSETPIYYGYFFPERLNSEILSPFVPEQSGMVINARSTALAMTLMNPLLFDSTVDQRAMVAEEILQHDLFPDLVGAIEDVKTLDPRIPIKYEMTPDLFVISAQITIDSMKRIAGRLPDRQQDTSSGLRPEGVSYDYDMAYPQNNGDGTITIYNPKMAHYVAGVQRTEFEGDPDQYTTTYIAGKERWLDISIFPPRVETVPPTETPLSNGLSAGRMHIYKGFQFDFPFNELWSILPARMAMVANAWASWTMMMALAGDISAIYFPHAGGFINFMADNLIQGQSFEAVWSTVNTRDRIQTIDSMYDVFLAVLPAIENHMESRFGDYTDDISGNNGTMTQITTIFKSVWNLVAGGGIVNSIIDITTQVIPFYFDLFTAHSYSVYPVFDGSIQPLPDSPTISRVMPTQLSNGRNAVAYGFDFGGTAGSLQIIGASGDIQEAEVISWADGSIVFKVPDNETGWGDGEQKTVFVTVLKDDGISTNQMEIPFVMLEAGEGGGGGGCSAASGSADGSLPLIILFALILPVVRRRYH